MLEVSEIKLGYMRRFKPWSTNEIPARMCCMIIWEGVCRKASANRGANFPTSWKAFANIKEWCVRSAGLFAVHVEKSRHARGGLTCVSERYEGQSSTPPLLHSRRTCSNEVITGASCITGRNRILLHLATMYWLKFVETQSPVFTVQIVEGRNDYCCAVMVWRGNRRSIQIISWLSLLHTSRV